MSTIDSSQKCVEFGGHWHGDSSTGHCDGAETQESKGTPLLIELSAHGAMEVTQQAPLWELNRQLTIGTKPFGQDFWKPGLLLGQRSYGGLDPFFDVGIANVFAEELLGFLHIALTIEVGATFRSAQQTCGVSDVYRAWATQRDTFNQANEDLAAANAGRNPENQLTPESIPGFPADPGAEPQQKSDCRAPQAWGPFARASIHADIPFLLGLRLATGAHGAIYPDYETLTTVPDPETKAPILNRSVAPFQEIHVEALCLEASPYGINFELCPLGWEWTGAQWLFFPSAGIKGTWAIQNDGTITIEKHEHAHDHDHGSEKHHQPHEAHP